MQPTPGTSTDAPTAAAAAQLRTRVVREAHRHTWFVVNEGTEELTVLPLARAEESAVRRAEVNGEAAEFASSIEHVVVTPRRALRPGAGTIVVLHYR